MKYKKTMILLVLAIFIFGVASVCASDVNETTIATQEDNQMELTLTEDEIQTNENDNMLTQTEDAEILTSGEGSYSDLRNDINSGGNLTKSHYRYNAGDGGTIEIYTPGVVINGNGAVIDMAGSNIRAFYIGNSDVTINNLTIKNANYNGNGGAIYFYSTGTVSNCNFINNKATGIDSWGGAVSFNREGAVTNCNFTGNNATRDGGAINIGSGTVSNCNFTNNSARYGGAVEFDGTGNVTNCNFVDNKAAGDYSYGGAVNFWKTGTVTNCNFTNNSARYGGGAVYFDETGTVLNCNFTNNTANRDGGAINMGSGTVSNCNFTGNNATTGSAIYFWSTSATKTVSNSTFLNNRANAEALEITKNDNNITITFTGQNNFLNAIYSRNDAEVTFNNVTYWGAKGITTVSAKLSGSNKATGQNITVKGVVNGKIIDKINVTDENGEIVLDDAGDYWIIVSHKGDLYYTEIAETLFTNMKLYANVTSLTTNNKTVNITAKSNIFSEVMPGKLLFFCLS